MFDDHSIDEVLRRGPGYAVKTARRLAIRQYMEWYFGSHPAHPAQSRDGALTMVRAAESVLVLCWGNICRSPLAEGYLEARCQQQELDLTVNSAGLGETEGRESPRPAVEIAADYGVDLSNHRSTRIQPDDVSTADVVFVMDYNNYYSLTTRYVGARHKTFFLGALDDAPSNQIGDPFGSDRAGFEETYDRITTAIDGLVDELSADET